MANRQSFEQLVESIEQQLHAAVDNDDDHALFIASYLHGHFDLVVSQVLSSPTQTVQALNETMLESLSNAFDNNELIESDASQVKTLWASLVSV
jgi:hypothetical protein